jgi:hypothetical protein
VILHAGLLLFVGRHQCAGVAGIVHRISSPNTWLGTASKPVGQATLTKDCALLLKL